MSRAARDRAVRKHGSRPGPELEVPGPHSVGVASDWRRHRRKLGPEIADPLVDRHGRPSEVHGSYGTVVADIPLVPDLLASEYRCTAKRKDCLRALDGA